METLPRRVYTAEFRQQAVEMITRDGLSIAEAARRLVISPKTLLNWVRRAKSSDSPQADPPLHATWSRRRRRNSPGCAGRTRSCGWSATF